MSKRTLWIVSCVAVVVALLAIIIPVYIFESPDAMLDNSNFNKRVTQLTKQTRSREYDHADLVNVYKEVRPHDTNRQVLAIARPNVIKTLDHARKTGTFLYESKDNHEQVYVTFEDGYVDSVSYNNTRTEHMTEEIGCPSGNKYYKDGQIVKNKQATMSVVNK